MNAPSTSHRLIRTLIALLLIAAFSPAIGQAPPGILNYQGRLVVNGVHYDGLGHFKFALVAGVGGASLWANDGVLTGEPTSAVPLPVSQGLYQALLGDTAAQGMSASIPANVFTNADVRLRVWFSSAADGPFELLAPDHRIASVGYALMAASVAPGGIQSDQLPADPTFTGVVTATGGFSGDGSRLTGVVPATNSVTGDQLADASVSNSKLATPSIALNLGDGLIGDALVNLGGTLQLSTTATSSNTPNAIVSRGTQGEFAAGTISAKSIALASTADAATGLLTLGGNRLLHGFGAGNTFLGILSGNFAMSGGNNTAVGNSALLSNSNGWHNSAVGFTALRSNTSGTANAAHGSEALSDNTQGSFNTALGYQSLANNTLGSSNTAVGYQALSAVLRGNNNIALGTQAGVSLTNGNNNIYVGNLGAPVESDTLRLGGAQSRAFVAGVFGSAVSAGSAVFADSAGQLGTINSSRRFKEDIQDMGNASDVLRSLRPVTFRYKAELDPQGASQFGLIAEEVQEVAPDLVVRNAQGELQSVRYEAVNAMLLNEFQKQGRRAQQQEATIRALQLQVGDLSARLAELNSLAETLKQQVESRGGPESSRVVSLNAASR